MFKTYVLHYTKLETRKTHILNQLASQNIDNYELITDFDKEELTTEIIDQYYQDNKKLCDQYSAVTLNHHKSTESVYKKLLPASISLCIKHVEALNKFQSDKEDNLLVLEDDCAFYSNIKCDINHIINNAPKDWDIIFIGGAFAYNILSIKNIEGNYISVNHPATNTTSSFIYNKKSAKTTLDSILPFYLPIDWQLNYVFAKNNFNVYHTYPYLCTQLSNVKNGFVSTVER